METWGKNMNKARVAEAARGIFQKQIADFFFGKNLAD
jgi:hypothetical protein